MSFEIVTIPCRQDNYAFLIHHNGRTALVDAPEERPIRQELAQRGWTLDEIWITHHHDDHISAVEALRGTALVRGAAADQKRLPPLDSALNDAETFDFAGAEVLVMDVSGHTIGHIAFYVAQAKAAFTADSLMAFGCGRVFEGSFDQMWESLSKLAALPADTLIYSGHEYVEGNGRFAITIEPDNPAVAARLEQARRTRAAGGFNVPSTLAEEHETNPFLRAGLASVKSFLNIPDAPDSAAFAEIRRRKDLF